jgi:hypothetical protein
VLVVASLFFSYQERDLRIKIPLFTRNGRKEKQLSILLASSNPDPSIFDILARQAGLQMRESFTTQGLIQELPGVNLVIHDAVFEVNNTSQDLVDRALEMSGVPVVSPEAFLAEPDEWLSRARLASATKITFLPPRQLNLVNWSGGVGKTTLAMAICKRFVEQTGLPAALLELSMGGSALQARISSDLPEFYSIVTGKEEPGKWHGVSLYPMDRRSIEVLWGEDPAKVRDFLSQIRRKNTLFVVDCYPGHVLFPIVTNAESTTANMVVSSPRDDAMLQAKRLLKDVSQPAYLIMNMTRSLADQAGSGAAITLPHNERWAQALDARLADPLLALVYHGWNRRKK